MARAIEQDVLVDFVGDDDGVGVLQDACELANEDRRIEHVLDDIEGLTGTIAGQSGALAETWIVRRAAPLRKRFALVAGDDVEGGLKAAYAAIAFSRFSATLSRKPVVESQRCSAPTRSARSLVM